MTQEELKNQILQIMDEYYLTEFVKDKIVNVIDEYIENGFFTIKNNIKNKDFFDVIKKYLIKEEDETEQEDDGSCGCGCDEDD